MLRRAPSLVLALAGCAGCTLDWTVGSGSPPMNEAGTDASPEAAAVDAAPESAVDAPIEAPAPNDAEAGALDAPDCSALLTSVQSAEVQAKKCMGGSDCMTKVSDQCGCMLFVAQPASLATNNYIGAVQAFMTSGCPLNCPTQCPPPPAQSLCLVGMGGVTSCMP
jgi:hypothetical protein